LSSLSSTIFFHDPRFADQTNDLILLPDIPTAEREKAEQNHFDHRSKVNCRRLFFRCLAILNFSITRNCALRARGFPAAPFPRQNCLARNQFQFRYTGLRNSGTSTRLERVIRFAPAEFLTIRSSSDGTDHRQPASGRKRLTAPQSLLQGSHFIVHRNPQRLKNLGRRMRFFPARGLIRSMSSANCFVVVNGAVPIQTMARASRRIPLPAEFPKDRRVAPRSHRSPDPLLSAAAGRPSAYPRTFLLKTKSALRVIQLAELTPKSNSTPSQDFNAPNPPARIIARRISNRPQTPASTSPAPPQPRRHRDRTHTAVQSANSRPAFALRDQLHRASRRVLSARLGSARPALPHHHWFVNEFGTAHFKMFQRSQNGVRQTFPAARGPVITSGLHAVRVRDLTGTTSTSASERSLCNTFTLAARVPPAPAWTVLQLASQVCERIDQVRPIGRLAGLPSRS